MHTVLVHRVFVRTDAFVPESCVRLLIDSSAEEGYATDVPDARIDEGQQGRFHRADGDPRRARFGCGKAWKMQHAALP